MSKHSSDALSPYIKNENEPAQCFNVFDGFGQEGRDCVDVAQSIYIKFILI